MKYWELDLVELVDLVGCSYLPNVVIISTSLLLNNHLSVVEDKQTEEHKSNVYLSLQNTYTECLCLYKT